MNHEIKNLVDGKIIVKYIKAQKLKRFGHIQRREQDALMKKILKYRSAVNSLRSTENRMGRPNLLRYVENEKRNEIQNKMKLKEVTEKRNIIFNKISNPRRMN